MKDDFVKLAPTASRRQVLQALSQVLAGHPSMSHYWRVALALLLCATTWLALTSVPPQQANLGWDKLNHAAAFAALATVAFLGFTPAWMRIAVALLAYGGLIEVLQSFTATRSAEWSDLLADGAGIGLGLLLGTAVVQAASRGTG